MSVDDAIVEYLRELGFPVSREQMIASLSFPETAIAPAITRLLRERRIRSPFNLHYDIESIVAAPRPITREPQHDASVRISPPPATPSVSTVGNPSSQPDAPAAREISLEASITIDARGAAAELVRELPQILESRAAAMKPEVQRMRGKKCNNCKQTKGFRAFAAGSETCNECLATGPAHGTPLQQRGEGRFADTVANLRAEAKDLNEMADRLERLR